MASLADVVAARPELFYAQEWWHVHTFACRDHAGVLTLPEAGDPMWGPEDAGLLPFASTLAELYVTHPDARVWRGPFLWTADRDDHGHRVYVGGVGMHGVDLFQVHRALDYDNECVIPVWAAGPGLV